MRSGSFFDHFAFLDESEEIFVYDSATLVQSLRDIVY
jgi:hypothetical protein